MSSIIDKNSLSNSKLILLLQTLSTKELKELKIWLSSPWSKKNKYYVPFFELLLSEAPSFSGEALVKKVIYKQLYKNKPYDNYIFNNLIRELSKEIQSYIAFLGVKQSSREQELVVRKFYLARNATDLYETLTSSINKKLDKQTGKSAEDYLYLNRLHQEIYFQASGHHRYKIDAPNLVAADEALDAFYLLEKYNYWHEAVARTKILKIEIHPLLTFDLPLLDRLQTRLRLDAIPLYQLRLQRNASLNWKIYLDFKKAFLKVFSNLSFFHQQSFLIFCINDVIQLEQMGHATALEDLLEWYQLGLSNDLLMEHGYLNENAFNNVILTASHLERADFLVGFIQEYGKKLPNTIKKDAYKWALAQLAFIQGDYPTVNKAFIDWLPKDKRYTIQAKITLLKANFKEALASKDLLKSFEDSCLAFEKYFHRNELYADDKNTSCLKFVQYARKIVHNKHNKISYKKWTTLIKAIEKEPLMLGKRWLKKEVDLIKRKG